MKLQHPINASAALLSFRLAHSWICILFKHLILTKVHTEPQANKFA